MESLCPMCIMHILVACGSCWALNNHLDGALDFSPPDWGGGSESSPILAPGGHSVQWKETFEGLSEMIMKVFQ